jgi:large subunit GTPase 1
MFLAFTDSSGNHPSKLIVGLVGYPNVGKSSTINSLLGEKKVSVSSTPGKTKHFQTIVLSPTMVLCDCPGLVFPQFTTTKADLVCDGVLPIDQMREFTGPISLLVKRLPKDVLEATYGLSIKMTSAEEGGDEKVTAENFLIAYASESDFRSDGTSADYFLLVGRGYTRSGQGNPDEARAARYILKDYVNAKLLYSHPPPGISEASFNERTHELALLRAVDKKRAPVTRVGKGADTFVPSNAHMSSSNGVIPAVGYGHKSQAVDQAFFTNTSSLASRPFVQGSARNGQEYSRAKLFPHQNAVANDGSTLNGRQERIASVSANQGTEIGTGKKHHKKQKRVKQRSGKGYDM